MNLSLIKHWKENDKERQADYKNMQKELNRLLGVIVNLKVELSTKVGIIIALENKCGALEGSIDERNNTTIELYIRSFLGKIKAYLKS